MITVRQEQGFDGWEALLALIQGAFAFMEGRIDPPSSLARMDAGSLAAKAREETLLIAREDGALVGCAYLADRGDRLYIGKMAVAPGRQGRGIGRALMTEAVALARRKGLAALELQTRIELSENHKAFAALGFERTGETAHPGYDRPTSVTMLRRLEGGGGD